FEICFFCFIFFFFSSRRRHTRSKRDWSSDVCSSDLILSFVSNDCNPFIVISLSNLGELIVSGIIIAARIITQATTLHHLCFATNEPNLYKNFAKLLPP